jgi:hypothetical protein
MKLTNSTGKRIAKLLDVFYCGLQEGNTKDKDCFCFDDCDGIGGMFCARGVIEAQVKLQAMRESFNGRISIKAN